MKKITVERPEKVLCYLDLGKNSYYMVEYAHQLAGWINAELYFLHAVTDIRGAAGFYVPHINTDRLENDVTRSARDKMYAVCSEVIGEVDSSMRIIRKGAPLEVINQVVEEMSIELVILGHESSKGTLASFRSDYVERFLRQPACPFLVVPFKEAG
ncbi:MAG: universal stress protein [Thermodesulfobacteriota bacterium]|nr:universal stress protein [Thermodesulfobacteriota bacterium]